ncbi:MAG: HAD-IIIA family hydrolase [Puniceicoccales bacterium]|jgi:D-glycero-D-manno-heptose 1,7-bisphosphate phosphatase|nr:HAD-IIIA family hydrolase [Puniceicoccales bacterium]
MDHLSQNLQKSITKAIFLDRDGTLNRDHHFVFESHKIDLIEGTKEAIEIFLRHKFLLFLLTNQPGIELKMYRREDVEACNERVFELLENPPFTEICIASEATYSPENYRKPSPRFINEMVEKYRLERHSCYMVGDKETDAFAGINAGIKGVLLESEYPRSPHCVELIRRGTITVFRDLLTFAHSLGKNF